MIAVLVFIHCTALLLSVVICFLPSCTHPPRAPVTPLVVRYYSTELAPDMEEEEEEYKMEDGVSHL